VSDNKGLLPTIDMSVRIEALVAAGRLADPRTIPDLIALSTHKDYPMRAAAVFALGQTADRRSLKALFAATEDEDPSVRTLACLSMAEIRDASVTAKAIAIVQNEAEHDRTRAACAWLLGYHQAAAARQALVQALEHGNDETQRLAAWALGRLGDESSLSVLLEAYFTKRQDVRSASMQAIRSVLGKKKKRNATDADEHYLADYPMESQHFDASRAIANLATAPARDSFDAALLIGHEEQLASALRSAITRYRDLVLRALLELDARDEGLGLGALTASMKSLPDASRRNLEKTLTAVGRELVPELGELTQHRDPEVRRRSLNVLAKVGGEQAVSHLSAALVDTNTRVRKSAMLSAALLARLHTSEGRLLTDVVTKHLTANAWQERVAAATALSDWPEHGKTAELARALRTDTNGFVRSAAARALAKGQVHSDEVIAALVLAGSYKEESLEPVRMEAVRALHALGGDKARTALLQIGASDPSERVQHLARGSK
jgi:HEAT repeat protein